MVCNQALFCFYLLNGQVHFKIRASMVLGKIQGAVSANSANRTTGQPLSFFFFGLDEYEYRSGTVAADNRLDIVAKMIFDRFSWFIEAVFRRQKSF